MDTVNDLMSCGVGYFRKWEDAVCVISSVLIVIVYSNASSSGTVYFKHVSMQMLLRKPPNSVDYHQHVSLAC